MQRIAVRPTVGHLAAHPEHDADRERGEQGARVDGKQSSQDAGHPSASQRSWRAGRGNAAVPLPGRVNAPLARRAARGGASTQAAPATATTPSRSVVWPVNPGPRTTLSGERTDLERRRQAGAIIEHEGSTGSPQTSPPGD